MVVSWIRNNSSCAKNVVKKRNCYKNLHYKWLLSSLICRTLRKRLCRNVSSNAGTNQSFDKDPHKLTKCGQLPKLVKLTFVYNIIPCT